MLKISDAGLENYKEEYYMIISDKITPIIDKTNFSSPDIHKYITDNLKTIIIGKQPELEDVIKKFKDFSITPDSDDLSDYDKIKNIFDYKIISNLGIRDIILNKINTNVCPYCGRQYISNYGKKNSADIDHFYLKSKHPYLALSLFNFIPCCNICNSKMKTIKDFSSEEHLYPYTEGFEDDVCFDISDESLICDIINKKVEPTIIIDYSRASKEKIEKVEKNMETFKLEDMYKNHSKDVTDLLNKISIYNNNSYIDFLSHVFDENSNKETLAFTNDLVNSLFKEKNDDEILSKLYNDILAKYYKQNR